MRGCVDRPVQKTLKEQLSRIPAVAVLGPRQCGKSTLAKVFMDKAASSLIIDLERPADLRSLSDPEAYFKINEDRLICIDEIQNYPELFTRSDHKWQLTTE